MLMIRSYGYGAAGPGRRAPLASRLPVVAAAAAVALAMLQVAGAACAAGAAGGGPQPGSDGSSSSPDPKKGREPGKAWPPQAYPDARSVARARGFAAAAPARVAFAVTGAGEGVRGLGMDEPFSSASLSKAMLLAAELRRLQRDGAPLDDATRSLLEPMITYSDNDAASAVYARVGDGGLEEVARRAGMRSFEVTPGYWGGAQVTAADLTRFFAGLDENLPARHRAYAKRLLASVTSSQRWGIPAAAGGGWTVYFKGGWRPPAAEGTSGPVTHQAGLLVHRSGRRTAIAVLSDLSPGSSSYGVIEGITRRLLAGDPRPARWPAP
ncbi:MAG: hypothetical protein K0S15_1580 [Solirubrobacterales bacterium]|nr:hypothetical protein [Solirubrobacterales bacterium]